MCKMIFPRFNLKIERWKWNKEYRVYVSSLGRFKDEHKRNIPVKISSRTGYCNVETACGYKVAHRLVLLTFRPIPNAEDLTVDHINHNKRDNSLNNLEWVSREENVDRAKQDLLKDQILKTEVMLLSNTILCGGNAMFSDYGAAADFIITSHKKQNITTKENVINKIKKAVQYGNEYCGVKWKMKDIRKENR